MTVGQIVGLIGFLIGFIGTNIVMIILTVKAVKKSKEGG